MMAHADWQQYHPLYKLLRASALLILIRFHHHAISSMKFSYIIRLTLLLPAVSATHFTWPTQFTQWENGTKSSILLEWCKD